MSESTFNADLDAMVRGENVASTDKLTRFVTDLYGEEQNVTMPNALKLRIANDLGLAANEPTTIAAPVSRRTMRASEASQRSSRPWVVAFAVAAAILLALTGILRWGMPIGNEEPDNRFLAAPTVVPTVAATPGSSPEASEWMVPITDADCPEDQLIDRSEWLDVQSERAASYDQTEQRIDEPYSVPSSDDAEAAASRQRQAMACQNRGEGPQDRMDALPVESPLKAWENTNPEAAEVSEETYLNRLERSEAFSTYVEDDLGITVNDLVQETDDEPGRFWDPANAIQMADGRIALIPSWTTNSSDSMTEFISFAPVWIEVDGEWLLDEELFFCIGDCDDHWQERESVYPNQATPVASPEASPVADQSWMQPITPEECVTERTDDLPDASAEDFDAIPDREYNLVGPADPADAYAANDVARQYLACDYPESLLSDQAAIETSISSDEFSPFLVVTLDRQLADGISVSAQMQELGVTPADTLVPSEVGSTGFFAPNPEMAFVLDDGRISIMSVVVSSSVDGTQWALGTTLILVLEDGEWKVDDQLPICIGPCDDVLVELESRFTDAMWLYPISAEECERNAYLPGGLSDEQAAAIHGRQYQACEMSGDTQSLQGPEHRVTEGVDAQPLSNEIASLHSQNGEVPGSLQRIARQELWGEDMEFPSDPWTAYQPNSIVTLGDGRIAVLETTVVTPEIISSSGRTSPVITTALVWNVDGDSWLLDEEVTVCLGNCDSFWGEAPAVTPESTPVAIFVPETCESSEEFVPDFITSDRMVTIVRPGPSHASGVQIGVLGFNTPVQYLCEAEETTNPTVDRMDEGQRWLLVRAEDGTEGWVREVDLRMLPNETGITDSSATPESVADTTWMQPVNPEECPAEAIADADKTVPNGLYYSAEEHREVSYERSYGPFSEPDEEKGLAVAKSQRNNQACRTQPVLEIPLWTSRYEYETRTSEGRQQNYARSGDIDDVSLELSHWFEDDLGVSVEDVWFAVDAETVGVDSDAPSWTTTVYLPEHTVEFSDGRVAILESQELIRNESASAITVPEFVQVSVAVFVQEGDRWLLDEHLALCLGECDAYWAETEIAACEVNGLEPDYRVHADGPVNMWPEPGVDQGDANASLDPDTLLIWMCESEPTTNPESDLLEEDQMWMLFRTEDGTEGWIREIDVHEIEP